jgi:hypothetical protein
VKDEKRAKEHAPTVETRVAMRNPSRDETQPRGTNRYTRRE